MKIKKIIAKIKKAQEAIENSKVEAGLHVWLDDVRLPPAGFIWVKTPEEAIKLLKTNKVEYISLDHDLSLSPEDRTGYMVAKWIEEHAYLEDLKPLAYNCHSQNPVGRRRMIEALMNADKYWANRRKKNNF